VPAQRIACPFCGLVCDDLVLAATGVDTRGCAKAAAGFARRPVATEHRVAGRAVALDAAAAAAAKLLAAARLPLITGLAADVAGLRALIGLADRLGAVIDRWQSAAQLANLALLQREGALAATFGEIANRADAVVLIGSDPAALQPRFFARLLAAPRPLFRAAPPYVAYLGPAAAAPRDAAVSERVMIERDRLLDGLGVLAALASGRRPARSEDLPIAALSGIAERLQTARYGALVWDIAAFAAPLRDAAASILLHLLRRLSRKTRAVGLPLGGEDDAQGASQTMLWQAGWPGRLSFAAGAPRHDPWLCDSERLLAAGEADALLWVAALSAAAPPPTRVPTVALIAADAPAVAAEVEIRVGIPGLDHGGSVIRADTVVALPLAATRPSSLPSVATAAAAIAAQLPAAS
jgi:formylmethanofuran dehydrogenase subunit B